jgi:hypothetical protein
MYIPTLAFLDYHAPIDVERTFASVCLCLASFESSMHVGEIQKASMPPQKIFEFYKFRGCFW